MNRHLRGGEGFFDNKMEKIYPRKAFGTWITCVRHHLGVNLLLFYKFDFQFKSLPTFHAQIPSSSWMGVLIKDFFEFTSFSFLERAVTSSASCWTCPICCQILISDVTPLPKIWQVRGPPKDDLCSSVFSAPFE